MSFVTVFKALGPIDGRNIRRDSMLRWMLFAPILIALIFRWLIPWAVEGILNEFGFDLRPYYPVLYSYLILIAPVMSGVVIGFLLLDERDDQTIIALQVTPMSMNNYLSYRLGVPTVISILLAPLVLWLAGVTNLSIGNMLLVGLLAAPLAAMFALTLITLAPNKVQGFAIMKGLGIFLVAPLLAWFISMPLQLLFGILPTYWPVKLFWMLGTGESGAWLVFIMGMVYQMAIVFGLITRFNKVMYR